MKTNTPIPKLLFGGLIAVLAASCGSAESEKVGDPEARPGPAGSEVPDDALATVNGVPITVADVELASRNKGAHDKSAAPPDSKNVLETVIRQELVRQRAIELGLDKDHQYRQKLSRMRAQLHTFERGELGELYFREEIKGKAELDTAEARAFFDENEQRIRLELHVWQILVRDERQIQQAKADLDGGKPFEEVAAAQFSKLPVGRPPWDLGYLKWKQIPEPWQGVVYDLEPGDVSDIIRGPRDRFWIIKLIDRRENTDLTFESVEQVISDALKNQKIGQRREQTGKDLRASARIEYFEPKPHPRPEPEP